ncbi:MAG: HMA2 domain-containing protein [Gammaproteobacteria bacterium]
MKRIVSSIPGRIRVRDKNLRKQAKLDALQTELSKIPAITELTSNIRTGSVLIVFDPKTIEQTDLETNLISALDRTVGTAITPAPPLSKVSKKNLNRYNKLVMLASLGSSLTFAASHRRRWRRWHTLTGTLFIANLAVHLFIYRKALRRLFR